jgi:hypothetical protein
MGTKEDVFTIVLDKRWHMECGDMKFTIIGDPVKVKDGYQYEIKHYEGSV